MNVANRSLSSKPDLRLSRQERVSAETGQFWQNRSTHIRSQRDFRCIFRNFRVFFFFCSKRRSSASGGFCSTTSQENCRVELNTARMLNWGLEEMEIYEKDIQEREKEAKEMERKWKWCLAKLRKIAGIWWSGWERMKKLHSPASSASFHSSVLPSLHLCCLPQWHSALN